MKDLKFLKIFVGILLGLSSPFGYFSNLPLQAAYINLAPGEFINAALRLVPPFRQYPSFACLSACYLPLKNSGTLSQHSRNFLFFTFFLNIEKYKSCCCLLDKYVNPPLIISFSYILVRYLFSVFYSLFFPLNLYNLFRDSTARLHAHGRILCVKIRQIAFKKFFPQKCFLWLRRFSNE